MHAVKIIKLFQKNPNMFFTKEEIAAITGVELKIVSFYVGQLLKERKIKVDFSNPKDLQYGYVKLLKPVIQTKKFYPVDFSEEAVEFRKKHGNDTAYIFNGKKVSIHSRYFF